MFVGVVCDVFGDAAVAISDAGAARGFHDKAYKAKELVFDCLQLNNFGFSTANLRLFLLNFMFLRNSSVNPLKKLESYYCLSEKVSVELSYVLAFAALTLLLLQVLYEEHLMDEARLPLSIALHVFVFRYLFVLRSDQKSVVFFC